MLKELAQYIETNTDLIIGTDLFPGFATLDAGDCVILIESGGKPNFYLPDAPAKTLQVLSLAKDYWDAKENAETIYALLHGKSGISLTSYYINTMEAISEPQSLGQDEKGLFVISTNYILRIRNV